MKHLLNNIVWHTLFGTHAKYASGTDKARRYALGFSPIIGFADAEHPDFSALLPYCESGEHFYCDGWAGQVQPGWSIDAETTMYKMVWESAPPNDDDASGETLQLQKLTAEHAPQALELALLTRPGPFGLRTIELGDYYGYFDGPRLVAMAGERMHAGTLREISGVCTHPDFQGRGLARKLMIKLIARQMQREEIPFLHVMRDNSSAHSLYQRMGFSDYQESVVRVVSLR